LLIKVKEGVSKDEKLKVLKSLEAGAVVELK
jgi:hypothetical protein